MIHDGYKRNQFTVSDVVSYYLKNIELIDKAGPELNSIISVNKNALKIALKLDSSLIKDKEIGPLFGIPVIIKDNINTLDGLPTTAGSRVLAKSYPTKNSWIANELQKSNAIILGKLTSQNGQIIELPTHLVDGVVYKVKQKTHMFLIEIHVVQAPVQLLLYPQILCCIHWNRDLGLSNMSFKR